MTPSACYWASATTASTRPWPITPISPINSPTAHCSGLTRKRGGPLGTALQITYPVGTVGDDNHLNMAFGVAEDGVVYVGVGDTIRRYAPSGSGFGPPTVAFTAPSGTPQPAKIQFSEFRVSGGGPNTVIVTGNRDWYGDVDRILTTVDGDNLCRGDRPSRPAAASAGAASAPSFRRRMAQETTCCSGPVIPRRQTELMRACTGADSLGATGDFVADTFNPEQVPGGTITNSTDVIYRTFFLTDVQSMPGLPYVVGYSTPSFPHV